MRSLLLTFAVTATLSLGCTIIQTDPNTAGGQAAGGLELNTDRPGGDYRSFDLATPRAEQCRDTCMVEPSCAAFTYVNPGIQGPTARCWLKSSVPNSNPSACCISGVKSPVVYQTNPGYNAPPPAQPAPPPSAWAGTPPPAPAPRSAWVGTPPPPAVPTGPALETNIDRPGSDYANFDLGQARPDLCRDACARDVRCRAFTYVNPGVQGPNPRCWLKNSAPPATPNACCVSGVR
jgi:hypothetical protein